MANEDWRILCQWQTKIGGIIKPDGYFERKGFLRGDMGHIYRSIHEKIGQILEQTSTSAEGSHVLKKNNYLIIDNQYSVITILMKSDRWTTQELDLLELDNATEPTTNSTKP